LRILIQDVHFIEKARGGSKINHPPSTLHLN
jgi:hypothetical protein